jgi:hypothetical protein
MSKVKVKEKVKVKVKEKAKPGKRKITDRDRKMAKFCVSCALCRYARKKQKGAACKAYERVYGRKAHQPVI